ncbi:MAG TPA: VanZ family protein [Ignavibacteria bacterium]|nr:VanZ family protein [Ignavibacteria bacterium]
MNSKTIHFFKYHFILYCYLVIIFIQSSIPGNNFPNLDFDFADKIIHFLIFAVLALLFFISLKNQFKYVKLKHYAPEFALLFSILYGISDEIHQKFTPGRFPDLYDVIANSLGALFVYIIIKIYYHSKKLDITKNDTTSGF